MKPDQTRPDQIDRQIPPVILFSLFFLFFFFNEEKKEKINHMVEYSVDGYIYSTEKELKTKKENRKMFKEVTFDR